jgi:hypothetical protein
VDAAVERLVRRRLRHGYTLVDWSPSQQPEVP